MGMDPLGEDWFCEDFVELNGKRFSREDWCRDDYVEVDVASPWADNEKKNLDDPVSLVGTRWRMQQYAPF